MEKIKKIILSEKEMPTQWYNITADLPNAPLPMLNPKTKQPATPEDLLPIFAEELVKQEFSTSPFIDIPEEVQDLYRLWRPTPLVRAYALEKALDTPAHIYFKNESTSMAGSHKPNTAIPQAYYNHRQGIRRLTTETGGGQWGSALSFAAKHFGLELTVFMERVSYEQKPYRKLMMQTWGAEVIPSPSRRTATGRKILHETPDTPGSLGTAVSEAVEMAISDPGTNYAIGSVMNHVLLHQTGVFGLHHVGGGAVHQGGFQAGEQHPVQGVRVAGAEDVLHLLPLLLHGRPHPPHQGGLAAARPALQDADGPGLLRGGKLVVQGGKAGGGVGPQEKAHLRFRLHEYPSTAFGLSLQPMRRRGGGCGGFRLPFGPKGSTLEAERERG